MCAGHVGALDFQEIKKSLINLGIKTDEKEIHKLLQRYGTDQTSKGLRSSVDLFSTVILTYTS